MSERYLSIKEVAERTGTHYQTIWQAVKRGELPAVRVGGAIRIPESALLHLPPYAPLARPEES